MFRLGARLRACRYLLEKESAEDSDQVLGLSSHLLGRDQLFVAFADNGKAILGRRSFVRLLRVNSFAL